MSKPDTGSQAQGALDIFSKWNFDVTNGGGQYWHLRKKFHDGFMDVTVRGFSSGVYVRISGTSIKQERSIQYQLEDANDCKKLNDRVKRLLKNANNYAEIQVKKQQKNDKSYEQIRDALLSLGALSKKEKRTIHQHWGGKRAHLKINGYEIVVNEDMETQVRIGAEVKYVNIEPAIQIVNLMPTHVPYSDDD